MRRSTKTVSLNQLKISELVKHENLFFLHFEKNSNNSPMGVKIHFKIRKIEEILLNF